MNTGIPILPTDILAVMAVLLVVMVSAVGYGQSTRPSAGLLPPAPKLTDLERQWSRAWVGTAAGVGAGQPVQVECLAQGWGAMHWNENLDSQLLCLGGKKFATGLATHADSDIRVRVPLGAKRLRVLAGVDANDHTGANEASPIAFAVRVGDKTVWSCEPRLARDGAVEVDVDLAGAKEFHLIARCPSGSIRFAHADWVLPVLTLADDANVDLSRATIGLGTPALPPFSFRYGGKSSDELLSTWQVKRSTQAEPGGVQLHRTVWKDPQTQLECVMDLREYPDFPTAKWVVNFRNAGGSDSPVLEDIQAIDTAWNTTSKARLVYAKGSDAQIDDFQTATASLPQRDMDKPLTFGSRGGRPSTLFLPYFNLQDGQAGVMVGIGWSGQWAATFDADLSGRTRVRAGMEKTHLVLHPGEEIRTPSILAIFWNGEPMRGHNLLRQFILHHNAPRTNDRQIVQAPLALGAWGGDFSSTQIQTIQRNAEAGLGFDIFWIDAGWFGNANGQFLHELTGHWYRQAGNWNIDKSIHPDAFQEVRQTARAAGLGMLLWVEPERAIWDSKMTQDHPDWYLGKQVQGQSVLLNLGNEQARQWATDLISGLVKDLDLTWYRQDFNMDCLDQWRANDAPDRQGMTEISHVEGLYAFWDELRRRHPDLMIDNCASGGRRLDLELLSRSMPLWRTDYHCPGREHDPIGGQVHTMGLSYWIPLSGTAAGAEPLDTYTFRSNLTAAMGFGAPGDVMNNAPVRDWCRKMVAEHKQARPFFYGDYYPLTRTSPQSDSWAAYQFDRRDLEQGMLVLLRRTDSPFSAAQFKLGGLDPAASYAFTDADTAKVTTCTGKEALAGSTWTIDTPRASRLIFYRKVKP